MSRFGVTAALPFLPAGIPITGIAGDQQAALFGQGGFEAGDAKCTYGTGAFFLLHTGAKPIHSTASPAHQPRGDDRTTSRSMCSKAASSSPAPRCNGCATVSSLIAQASDSESAGGAIVAGRADSCFVPGFVGLGTPHWAPDVRGVLFGLTRNTSPADLARAALRRGRTAGGRSDRSRRPRYGPTALQALRVDGGMARNDWFLQCQANLLGRPVLPSLENEATAHWAPRFSRDCKSAFGPT